jgi:histidine triad (HIT) family protein
MASESACVFCRILRGELPAQKVYEDVGLLAVRDIAPQAPIHILLLTREHIPSLNEVQQDHALLLGQMVLRAREIARQEQLAEQGYRLVLNCGPAAGQSVPHLHLHLLGGRAFHWPPG